MTSDAGFLLLQQADRRLGLVSAAADAINDRRHDSYVRHGMITMLRHGPLHRATSGADPLTGDHASQPPVSRLDVERGKKENRVKE